MSFRAVIFGLLGAVAVAAGSYFVVFVYRLPALVASHLPVSIFGMLVVLALFVNPLLYKLRPSWRLKTSEMAIVLVLTTIGAGIGGPGFTNFFTNVLALPMYHYQRSPGWKKNELLKYVPPSMLPGEMPFDEEVTGDFIGGLGREDAPIDISQVPWAKWKGPLVGWLPLFALSGLAVICLSLIIHRQWSVHERLRYPIAEFASALMVQDPGHAFGRIFRNRFFWLGMGAILCLHLVNGLHAWFPTHLPNIPLQFDFSALTDRFKNFTKAPHTRGLYNPRLFPTVIAFSFLLASDVSFTLGITHIVFVFVVNVFFLKWGLPPREDHMLGGVVSFSRFGGFVAMTLMLLYTGRRYYGDVVKQAFGFARRSVESYAAWACRFLVVCLFGMIAMLTLWGLDWPLAILAVLIIMMYFVGVSRLYTESGLFFLFVVGVYPLGMLTAAFGPEALGPAAMVILGMTSCVIAVDLRGSMMPFVVNGLKIAESAQVQPARIGRWAMIAFLLGLMVAVPTLLWAQYNYGVAVSWWEGIVAPRMTFTATQSAVTVMNLRGSLAESESYSPLERLLHINPSAQFKYAATAGFVLVLVLSSLRLRFTWWPIHPLLLMAWGTSSTASLGVSFLLGWVIKTLVTKLGGGAAYRHTRYLMIGVITADLFSGLTFQLIGFAYKSITGLHPRIYSVLLF